MSGNSSNNNDNDKTGDVISWIIIVILMFALPPAGWILLLIKLGVFGGKKDKSDKHTVKVKKKRSRLDKKTGKGLATLLLFISIAMIIAGVSATIGALTNSSSGAFANFAELGWGAFYLLGGIITFFSRNVVKHRYSRYKNYYASIGGRGIVPLDELAQIAGVSNTSLIRDLQTMINNGYLDYGAYIDHELECLVLSAEDARKLRAEILNSAEINSAQDNTSESNAIQPNQYMVILAELREANSFIADETISRKVAHLEELTAKIFRIVEETPEKQPQLRRFISYYLPTTLKLARSYVTLETQGVKGENIATAKESIGNILDTLATGYEQQLDKLFKSDVIDIAADINVLENLMQQDGLMGDKSQFQVLEG